MCLSSPAQLKNAGMTELADVTDSKSVVRDGVWVQVPLPAPHHPKR